MQNRISTRVFLSLGMTCITLLLAASLAVGSTYGRYFTVIQGQMALTADLAPEPTLYSWDGDGNITAYAPQWLTKGGQQYQEAVLRNSSLEDNTPPRQTVSVCIRVFVPDDSDAMGALSFTLSLDGGAVLLSSAATYLGANTPGYMAGQTPGWVYCFYETNAAAEYIHTFSGGAFDTLPMTVAVQNTTVDCSRFQIYVERVSAL